MMEAVLLALGAGVLTLLYAAFIAWKVSSAPAGTDKMQDIAKAIQEGANAFLMRQYKTLAPIVLVLLALISIGIGEEAGMQTALAFLGGVLSSALAGYIGMQVSVRANVRVAEAAKKGLQ
ncbi:MAG: sodium/proton-translocating pyrophosphatase, partial [Candidatus Micrarchaeota archaeon]